ncbi:MAG: signal recognition particle-docking protein FtsY [Gammaproteobacteria bacterium]|nr:signal recognition particle-docking protein FtsY [Gammaproteobacteria bacterium]
MPESGVFSHLRQGLLKTRNVLTGGIPAVSSSFNVADLLAELEDRLLLADVGIETTTRILDDLNARQLKRAGDAQAAQKILQDSIAEIMAPCNKPLLTRDARPFTILVIGINGAGKTTTIGKIAHRLVMENQSVMLAAGDTFRAAAAEQLQSWGKKIGVPVVAQKSGADSAAVVFDAYSSAMARKMDVLIADTAGRLHTQQNLMDELLKIKRAMQKIEPQAPHEILLVLEAGTGQNALKQATGFHRALDVTGLCITKLDGTAKGGTVIAIADRLGIPIRYIGIGEGIEDLRVFDAYQYAQALLQA